MRKVFLSSTKKDILSERIVALQELKYIEKCGGPKLICYEEFLSEVTEPFVPRAIESCLTHAAQATEAILLLRRTAGSPCITKNKKYLKYINGIQAYVNKKRKHVFDVLIKASRALPPISWVEVYIIYNGTHQYKLSGGPSPHVLALIDPALVTLAEEYKKGFSDSCDFNTLKTFFDSYAIFVESNRIGSGGRGDENDYVWRLVWLCEFQNWLTDSANIPRKDLNNPNDVINEIKSRYLCYSETMASGSVWFTDDSILDSFAYEFDGEVWIWNNDLSYLVNSTKFERLYKTHLPSYEKARIVISPKKWSEIKKLQCDKIKGNLKLLDKKTRSKILVGFKNIDDDISVTLFGIDSTRTDKKMMILRPMTWKGRMRRGEFYSNLVIGSNSVNNMLIDKLSQELGEEMRKMRFSPLMGILTDYIRSMSLSAKSL